MRVLLVGAGRYGNGLVGRKYVSGQLKADLIGVVDPKIDEIKRSASYCLNGVPTYHSIDEIPSICLNKCVADIALLPQIVSNTCKKLSDKGVKKLILPKPVSETTKEFDNLLDMAEERGIDALVASNWHYAKITKMTKVLLDKLTGQTVETSEKLPKDFTSKLNGISTNYKISKVKVEYNKQNETLAIDPPLQELPHAMQIVNSVGCTNLQDTRILMDKALQSESRVNLALKSNDAIEENIFLNSDLKMKDKLDKKRERVLKIYLENNGEHAVVTVDYDAQFDMFGRCVKSQNIKYESFGAPETNWEYKVNEDNIEAMYDSMFDYFEGNRNDAMTLKKYNPISEVLCKAEELWTKLRR